MSSVMLERPRKTTHACIVVTSWIPPQSKHCRRMFLIVSEASFSFVTGRRRINRLRFHDSETCVVGWRHLNAAKRFLRRMAVRDRIN
jgi:hypothetical protein